MKNIARFLFIILTILLMLLCATACGGDATKGDDTNDSNDADDSQVSETLEAEMVDRLPYRTMELQADFFELAWEGVEGAVEYVVRIDGKEYRTADTVYSLMTHVHPGETKTLRVTAIVDGVPLTESAWGQIEYTAEGVTEGLVFTKQYNDTYSVYCPSNAIPKNGELVLPNTYEGKNVTAFRSEKLSLPPLGNRQKKSTSDYDGPAYTGISKVRLPAYLTAIEGGALYRSSVSKIYLPASVSSIGNSAFEGCEGLREITLSPSLQRIGNYAFSDCTSLTSITVPDGVKAVGMGAFARTGLREISLPMGVTRIEAYTYYGCEALAKIDYASMNLTSLDTEAFHNTLWYKNQPEGMVCYRIFLYEYKGEIPENTTLTVPEQVKRFASEAMFKDEPNLVAVSFPEGFLAIPTDTFSGCTNLKQVTLSEGLTSIGNGAFYNCPIEQITFPESLEYLGSMSPLASSGGAFENCTKLTSVTVPQGVISIGSRCFYGCTALESVTIEDGIEKIADLAFAHCTALTSLKLPESTQTFYLTSVAYTGVTSLVFPRNLSESWYYSMESGDGVAIKYLIIQKGTRFLDYHFFYRCESLKSFFFTGTEQEWERVRIDLGSIYKYDNCTQAEIEEMTTRLEAWQNALTVYFYSENEPTESGNYWHYVDGVPTAW